MCRRMMLKNDKARLSGEQKNREASGRFLFQRGVSILTVLTKPPLDPILNGRLTADHILTLCVSKMNLLWPLLCYLQLGIQNSLVPCGYPRKCLS